MMCPLTPVPAQQSPSFSGADGYEHPRFSPSDPGLRARRVGLGRFADRSSRHVGGAVGSGRGGQAAAHGVPSGDGESRAGHERAAARAAGEAVGGNDQRGPRRRRGGLSHRRAHDRRVGGEGSGPGARPHEPSAAQPCERPARLGPACGRRGRWLEGRSRGAEGIRPGRSRGCAEANRHGRGVHEVPRGARRGAEEPRGGARRCVSPGSRHRIRARRSPRLDVG